ncbi:hypothetical protein [Kluyvera intermedia]|uniref:Uncharacterized protein n=1 Tax=Kluyvera intermedia TaxID=61648 RepID=A0AA95K288_KLUIN|nr:hypothetical protein [Kluyvera intermedia]WGL57650.1 hypothetical protein QBD33_07715 [Kluyvera intermedia]
MSHETEFEDTDITNHFIEIHDVKISPFEAPNGDKRIMFVIDYDLESGDVLPAANEIYNCLTPQQARQMIECLQQSLDELDHGVSSLQGIHKH